MPGGLRRNRRGLSLQSEEGGRNCQEYKAGAARRDGRISPHPPRSQAQVPAHLGTSGSGSARAGDRCQCPGGSVAAGWGSWGTSIDLLSGCLPGGRLGGGGSSLSNLPRSPFPRPARGGGAGGRWARGHGPPKTSRTCGTRGASCLRRPSPGEGRLFRGWDSCGRRDVSAPTNS